MVVTVMAPRRMPTESDVTFLENARVARLATADASGTPSCVPVVFAWDGERVYIPIDRKPKSVEPGSLKRVRNIGENPRVALVVDDYAEDWSLLRYLMVRGIASYGPVSERALGLLREKYAQYEAMAIDGVITVQPQKFIGWRGDKVLREPG